VFQRPWYMIAGNHDWLGNVTAQLDYSRRSSRWKFPSLYYTQTFDLGSDGNALFVFIDTCSIVDQGDTDQLVWIQKTLAASLNYTWVVVIGHYPIYSVGNHGTILSLVNKVAPWFTQYKVAAYINGHEHGLQYIRYGNVSYIITGNVAKFSLQGLTRVPKGVDVAYYYPDSLSHIGACKFGLRSCFAFMTVKISGNVLSFQMWDDELNLLYTNRLTNPRSL